jgi:hypothetical protein
MGYYFLFTPTFSGKQLGRNTRPRFSSSNNNKINNNYYYFKSTVTKHEGGVKFWGDMQQSCTEKIRTHSKLTIN